ncbi:MAG: proton-conducting transporter membrane subunit [Bacillota bacterium]|nr:proton-conducting transporter membrane subunit [Bacillota bacterium]
MPLLFIGVPLAAVLALNLAYKWINEKLALYTAAAVSLFQIGVSAVCIDLSLRGGTIYSLRFIEKLSIDTVSAVVLFTIGLTVFVSLIVSNATLKSGTFNFINMLLMITIGMNGLAMVTDLFSLYVFIEATSAASFVLIGINRGRDELEGAFKYYLMSAIATVLMMTSVALFFYYAGDTSFIGVSSFIAGLNGNYPYGLLTAFILYTAGLLIKSGVVPFHSWVLDTYSPAPAPVSVLLAGIVTKVSGVYAVIRITRNVFLNNAAVCNVLISLGLLSVIMGALAAIGQKDMKRMLAYSSISQIGYIMLGIGSGSALGLAGALFHFFNHSTFKSLLFVDTAAIEMQTGTRDMDKMGGLAQKMPVTGISSLLAFLSTAGIPPLSGFWSKLLIIVALWKVSAPVAVTALAAGILTLSYFLIMQKKVFFGKVPETLENVREAGGGILGAEILLSVINVAAGILFPLALIYMNSIGKI